MAGITEKIELNGDATLSGAETLKVRLLEALGRCDELVLDLRGLESFDISFLQLLFSAQASAAAAKKIILFPAPPNVELVKLATDLGIARPEGVGDEWPW